ncbi:MAG: M20/M25/M40 family metallo-hydrolase [Candidatus Binatia bacterium]|nr:M20/M25/M40 family metallo-hydrolase [Candidatus Binatia bacterium]
MRYRSVSVLVSICVLVRWAVCPLGAAEPDWQVVEQEAADLLSRYVQIDTTNPPGNEIAAATFWQQVLAREGMEAQVWESRPGRGVVYARFKGSGERKALILLHHLDVVPAQRTEWDVDPFAGVIKDGYVYGRGAIDCKGVAVVQFLAVALLKRMGVPLKRDIIFLGTADEETGGQQGAGWFVENHFDLIADAEFLLTEGGGIRIQDGQRAYEVDIAEKAPCWIQLEASGPAGHGSRPLPDMATVRLVRALEKLLRYQTEIKVVPAVQAYFTALAEREDPDTAVRYRNLTQALTDPTFRQRFLANPTYNALVRNTIALTVLEGSSKTNVIPAQARAQLDCRLLPGEDPQHFLATLAKIVNDPHIRVTVLLNFPPLASDADTPLFRAIRTVAARRDPTAPVVPAVLTGFTDSHYFRRKGIVSYGFTGLALAQEDAQRVHGLNERVPIASLREGIQILFDVLQELVRNPSPNLSTGRSKALSEEASTDYRASH